MNYHSQTHKSLSTNSTVSNKYKRNGRKLHFTFRQRVARFREVSFKSSLFDHLDNDKNLQLTGIILEPSIELGRGSGGGTSAQQKAFTKEASRNKRAMKRLANRPSWRCCGLQPHPTSKLLASSNVFFVMDQESLPEGQYSLIAHSPTVAPHGAGKTVPKEHSVWLNIYSEKCISIWVKGQKSEQIK